MSMSDCQLTGMSPDFHQGGVGVDGPYRKNTRELQQATSKTTQNPIHICLSSHIRADAKCPHGGRGF